MIAGPITETDGAALGAAVAAGLSVHLWLGRRAPVSSLSRSPRPAAVLVVGLAGAGALATTALHGAHLVLALIGLMVVAAIGREVRRRREVVAADRRAEAVLVACEGLAADLRAGQPPVTALASAVEDWPELAPVAAAARLGADVPSAFRSLAAEPGADQLRLVAAAWQVSHRSGAGLAGALALAADRVRADRATARVVATELASAQATARLLAVLPLAVLLLGNGLGGDPVGFLLGTPAGLVCLAAGLSLEYAGLVWLGRIADRVSGRVSGRSSGRRSR